MDMSVHTVFELSGENYSFSKAELTAALEAGGVKPDFIEDDLPIVVEASAVDVSDRLALCHTIYEHVLSAEIEELPSAVKEQTAGHAGMR